VGPDTMIVYHHDHTDDEDDDCGCRIDRAVRPPPARWATACLLMLHSGLPWFIFYWPGPLPASGICDWLRPSSGTAQNRRRRGTRLSAPAWPDSLSIPASGSPS